MCQREKCSSSDQHLYTWSRQAPYTHFSHWIVTQSPPTRPPARPQSGFQELYARPCSHMSMCKAYNIGCLILCTMFLLEPGCCVRSTHSMINAPHKACNGAARTDRGVKHTCTGLCVRPVLFSARSQADVAKRDTLSAADVKLAPIDPTTTGKRVPW